MRPLEHVAVLQTVIRFLETDDIYKLAVTYAGTTINGDSQWYLQLLRFVHFLSETPNSNDAVYRSECLRVSKLPILPIVDIVPVFWSKTKKAIAEMQRKDTSYMLEVYLHVLRQIKHYLGTYKPQYGFTDYIQGLEENDVILMRIMLDFQHPFPWKEALHYYQVTGKISTLAPAVEYTYIHSKTFGLGASQSQQIFSLEFLTTIFKLPTYCADVADMQWITLLTFFSTSLGTSANDTQADWDTVFQVTHSTIPEILLYSSYDPILIFESFLRIYHWNHQELVEIIAITWSNLDDGVIVKYIGRMINVLAELNLDLTYIPKAQNMLRRFQHLTVTDNHQRTSLILDADMELYRFLIQTWNIQSLSIHSRHPETKLAQMIVAYHCEDTSQTWIEGRIITICQNAAGQWWHSPGVLFLLLALIKKFGKDSRDWVADQARILLKSMPRSAKQNCWREFRILSLTEHQFVRYSSQWSILQGYSDVSYEIPALINVHQLTFATFASVICNELLANPRLAFRVPHLFQQCHDWQCWNSQVSLADCHPDTWASLLHAFFTEPTLDTLFHYTKKQDLHNFAANLPVCPAKIAVWMLLQFECNWVSLIIQHYQNIEVVVDVWQRGLVQVPSLMKELQMEQNPEQILSFWRDEIQHPYLAKDIAQLHVLSE